MTKKRIERVSIEHRREIEWLRWYFLRDKKNPKRTQLEQMISESFLQGDKKRAIRLLAIYHATKTHVERSDKAILKTVKQVYVYQYINVLGACQSILYMSQSLAYKQLNRWFDEYFETLFEYLPIK